MLTSLLLLGLYSFGFAPAIQSERPNRMTAVRRAYRTQNPHVWRDLKIHYLSASADMTISWRGRNSRLQQMVKFPSGWWPTHDSIAPQRPKAFLWLDKSEPSLVIVAGRASGVYDIQAPVIFTLHNNRWRLTSVDPTRTEFTDRGSFYVLGNSLYVWDYGMESGYAHQAPQHYWIKTFVIKDNRLVKSHIRTTHSRYTITAEYPAPTKYPANNDPLREFGLRWRWWGEGRRAVKVQ
ncbi:MAG: hypothetical protein JWQ02_1905 [Capsulimonas sp.]|nr:hypothetical protein [Capsulimonas sp.]